MRISRLTLGMRNIIDVVRYDDFETDGLDQVRSFLDAVQERSLASSDRPADSEKPGADTATIE